MLIFMKKLCCTKVQHSLLVFPLLYGHATNTTANKRFECLAYGTNMSSGNMFSFPEQLMQKI